MFLFLEANHGYPAEEKIKVRGLALWLDTGEPVNFVWHTAKWEWQDGISYAAITDAVCKTYGDTELLEHISGHIKEVTLYHSQNRQGSPAKCIGRKLALYDPVTAKAETWSSTAKVDTIPVNYEMIEDEDGLWFLCPDCGKKHRAGLAAGFCSAMDLRKELEDEEL